MYSILAEIRNDVFNKDGSLKPPTTAILPKRSVWPLPLSFSDSGCQQTNSICPVVVLFHFTIIG